MQQLFTITILVSTLSLSFSHPILWAGGVTDTAASFRAVGLKGSEFYLNIVPDGENPVFSKTIDSDFDSFEVNGLVSGMVYYYSAGGEYGKFHTFIKGEYSFKIGLGSCTSTPSTSKSWVYLKDYKLDLFLMMGDLFYYNIAENNTEVYSQAYKNVFDSQVVRDLFHSTAIAYIWDDHDYGPNNSDGSAPGKVSARLTYQSHVPHYPFPNNRSGDVAIYQAFSIGNVRFILTDLRSEAFPNMMMSSEQEGWFFSELINFQNWDLVVWVSSRPWIGPDSPGSDDWGGFPAQRRKISQFIADNKINNLVVLSGDAHMVAIDDGSNTDYSVNGSAGFPIFQAAAIDRLGSEMTGPFSEGCYSYTAYWTEQFGIMEVYYNSDDNLCIKWSGYRVYDDGIGKLVTWGSCTPTVKKGNPGVGSCKTELMPIKYWLLLSMSYGGGIILIIIAIFIYRKFEKADKKGGKRRVILITLFFASLILSVVIIPLMMSVKTFGSYVYRPGFLAPDIGWVAVALDGIFFLTIIVDIFYSKKYYWEEEYYMNLK